MPFQIIRDDITRVKADAIVNTANPKPTYEAGVDSAIYEAAGEKELLAERVKIGEIARGDAVITPAFKLPAKYIIHTVGPKWDGGDKGEFDTLRSCYERSLELALEHKCRSIAFPLIATGVYGFPKDKALQIAMSVIQPFVMEHTMKVILVVFDRKAFELSGKVIDNIREYIDANYVEEAHKKEYRRLRLNRDALTPEEEEIAYSRQHMCDLEQEDLSISGAPASIWRFGQKKPESVKKPTVGKVDIQALIDSSEKTFQEKLFEIIDARGLTGPQVYKNYISKQVFSKIQADKNYHPNKYTAIALCLSLHLDLDETLDLIGRAGWTLSPSNVADLVVKGCILNKEYNIVQIDIILFDNECPPLEKIK